MHASLKAGATLGALLLGATLLTACGGDSDDAASTPAPTASAMASPDAGTTGTAPLPTGGAELADTTWALSGIATTTEDLSGSGITLEFAGTEASGNAGVNTYTAGYTAAADGTLAFTAIATTRMAGEEAATQLEAEYLELLGKVTGYSVSGGLLDLFVGPDQMLTFTAG
jgi:heat shock protein HslJ